MKGESVTNEVQRFANQLDPLAQEVMRLSQSTLLVNLRFLDAALMQFRLQPTAEVTLATLGRELYYNPAYILSCYMREAALPVRDYLHLVLRCVFRHMFIDSLLNAPRWDLACDVAVEGIISEFDLNATRAARQAKQAQVLAEFRAKVRPLTAEKLYRHLLDAGLSDGELSKLCEVFHADDHRLWHAAQRGQDAPGAGTGASPRRKRRSGNCGRKSPSGCSGTWRCFPKCGATAPEAWCRICAR